MKKLLIVLLASFSLVSCTENYSNGERIGLVTQFSETGIFYKSWEGHLNLTQTGMNSSTAVPFDFSIDNDRNDNETIIKTIDSAAQYGWKVKIIYHETFGKNWWHNRGETDHFVTKVEVLDKTPLKNAFGDKSNGKKEGGRVIDTIYVVIVPKPN